MESRRPGGGGARTVPGGGAVSAGYCAWNGLESAATNAAFTVAREYDILDRVTNVTYTARGGTPLYRLSYAYDPDGLVTQRVAVSASGAVTNSCAYDGLMRLVAESDSPGNSASYVYDLCGNRLSVTAPSGTVSSTYTHNRRDADTHDAGGRVTRTVNGRGQLLDLAWNLRGELTSVSTNGVFAEGYAYDPMGRRISTTDANGTVYHAYDGIHCVADLAPDGTLLRSYTWGSGVDIKRAQSPRRSRRATAILSPSRRDGARSGIPRRSGNCYLLAVTFYSAVETNTLYAVTDPLGTVHALVGTNGVPAVTYAYDSWGNLLSVSGDETLASALRFAWQGREYSHATALYNFRARWYDPAAGRWLSKDPIGLEGGLNLYEAFGNNPVCFVDPNGTDRYIGVLNWNDAIFHGGFHKGVAVDTWEKSESGVWRNTGQKTFDFRPAPAESFWDGLVNALTWEHGEVCEKDGIQLGSKYKAIVSLPEEDIKMLTMLRHDVWNPPRYNFETYNCASWANEVFFHGIEWYLPVRKTELNWKTDFMDVTTDLLECLLNCLR